MPSARSPSFSLVEPHPSAAPRATLHYGRGGAGNVTRAPQSVTKGISAQGPPARIPLASISSASSTKSTSNHGFHSGRGGAGNVHPPSERAIFSFDEELERQMSQERHAAPVYHVGRGGAGNVGGVSAFPGPRRSGSDSEGESDKKSARSERSVESGADVATRKMRSSFKKIFS